LYSWGSAQVALAWLALRGKLAPALASALVGGLLLFSLWPISTQVMAGVISEPVEHSIDVGKDDTVDFLTAQGGWGSFRVWEPAMEARGGSNRLAGFGFGTVSGYHPAKPRLFQDLRDASAVGSPRWLALLNVKYIVIDQLLNPAPPFLKLAHQGSAAVYENLAALPRVTVVGDYGVVADTGQAVIDSVGLGVRDSRVFTFLTKPPGVALGPVAGAVATVTHYGLQDVDIDVVTPGAGLVRLADQWYPDWKATVDGKAGRDPAGGPPAARGRRARGAPQGGVPLRIRERFAGAHALDWELDRRVASPRGRRLARPAPAGGPQRREPPDGQAGDRPDLQRTRERRSADREGAVAPRELRRAHRGRQLAGRHGRGGQAVGGEVGPRCT